MKSLVTVSDQFSASHHVPDHPRCFRDHGHLWRVSVTMSREYGGTNSTNLTFEHVELAAMLHSLCEEFHLRDINEMAPGILPVPEGLAIYFRERLVFNFPSVNRVSVAADGEYTAEMEWQLR